MVPGPAVAPDVIDTHRSQLSVIGKHDPFGVLSALSDGGVGKAPNINGIPEDIRRIECRVDSPARALRQRKTAGSPGQSCKAGRHLRLGLIESMVDNIPQMAG